MGLDGSLSLRQCRGDAVGFSFLPSASAEMSRKEGLCKGDRDMGHVFASLSHI